MISTDKLEEILYKCGIIKEFAPLPESVLGYYSFDGDYYVILINESIRNNEKLYRTVLAEEIGHYRGNNTFLRDKLVISIEDLIEYFCVTNDLIDIKFKFMSKEKGLWRIADNTYLSLLSLPSVYIYNKI